MTETDIGWVEKTIELNPVNYDQFRPTYPADLYSKILEFTSLASNSQILEIGIGTGQATEPFLAAGYHITALEPSANLADFARKKYSGAPNVSLVQGRFEEIIPNDRFDLIYAATSFHWIRSDSRMQLLQSHLKPGGAVALFWNHPRPLDPVHAAVQKVYREYLPDDPAQTTPPWTESDATVIAEEMEASGFKDVQTWIFHQERHLTTEQYLGLLHTYSNHLNQPDNVRLPLMKGIGSVIDSHGGSITIADTIDLHLGRT